jgi:hypothetical protein
MIKLRRKFHLITGREGAEGPLRYSFTLSLSSALDGDGWSTQRLCYFTPGKETRNPFYWRLIGPQVLSVRMRKISPPSGIRSLYRPARSKCLYRKSILHLFRLILRLNYFWRLEERWCSLPSFLRLWKVLKKCTTFTLYSHDWNTVVA